MPPWAKLLLVIGVLMTAGAITQAVHGDRVQLGALIGLLRSWSDSASAIPFFFLIFGIATSLFTPAVAMMITAGVTWGFWPGSVVVWGAANFWASIHFGVGRWIVGETRSWISRRGAGWLLRELDHGGVLTTIMVRQLPLPFLLVNVAAGASPLDWRKWVLGNALGLIPNSLIYTQLAAAIADGAEGAQRAAAVRGLMAALAMIALALLSRWLQRRMLRGPERAAKS